MQWSDSAIVLSARKYGENSAVIRLFSREHGVYGGVVKGASSKTNRGIYQPGNIVNATWNARLAEQLGMFKAELHTPNAALIMHDGLKLAALSSACAMIETALAERHPYLKLYAEFQTFLAHLQHDDDWLKVYIQLELCLLAEAGFGLDLDECAATGTAEDLIYVSPKSGRAVSAAAGEPYKDKLLKLPRFLSCGDISFALEEIRAGMQLTGFFLTHWLYEPHSRKLPIARQRLWENLCATAKIPV